MADEKFVTLKQAADMLGCSVTTIRRYIAEGKLKAFRRSGRGNVFFVERSQVENMLTFTIVKPKRATVKQ